MPTRREARTSVLPCGQNLDAGRIQFARADEGAGAPGGPRPAGASAGTQAEDALTMKKLYQACQK